MKNVRTFSLADQFDTHSNKNTKSMYVQVKTIHQYL